MTYIKQEYDSEFLIRVNLRYEKYSDAIEHALSLIRKVRLCRDVQRGLISRTVSRMIS